MNRTMRRASEQNGKRMQKKPWNSFKNVTTEAKQRHFMLNPSSSYIIDAVFQNNKFIVQVKFSVERKGKLYTRAMVRRSDSKPFTSWADLYRIKNEIFGKKPKPFNSCRQNQS